ncbi:uncharacterized protein LOC142240280 [Haematobia irritans]|uniref:uncharacterized protein LOC142240280 n=1 Tax=Haematobia irritans TaxID=7368 RepID=UPI003F50C579
MQQYCNICPALRTTTTTTATSSSQQPPSPTTTITTVTKELATIFFFCATVATFALLSLQLPLNTSERHTETSPRITTATTTPSNRPNLQLSSSSKSVQLQQQLSQRLIEIGQQAAAIIIL